MSLVSCGEIRQVFYPVFNEHFPKGMFKSVLQTQRVHPFPFRTRKLSSAVPKILGWRRLGKIGQCQHKQGKPSQDRFPCFEEIPFSGGGSSPYIPLSLSR